MATFPDMIQAELTPLSVEKLSAAVDGGMFEKKYMHHVTLAFKPDQSDYKKVVLFDPDNPLQDGEKVKIELGYHVYDEDFGVEAVTAFVKRLNRQEVISLNDNPHITISVSENRKPVDSNKLLDRTVHHRFDELPLELDGVIKFIYYNRK